MLPSRARKQKPDLAFFARSPPFVKPRRRAELALFVRIRAIRVNCFCGIGLLAQMAQRRSGNVST